MVGLLQLVLSLLILQTVSGAPGVDINDGLKREHKRSTNGDHSTIEAAKLRFISNHRSDGHRFARDLRHHHNAELHIHTESGSFEFRLNHTKSPLNVDANIVFNDGERETRWTGSHPDCFMTGHLVSDSSSLVVLNHCSEMKIVFSHGNHTYSVQELVGETIDGYQSAVVEKTEVTSIVDHVEPLRFEPTEHQGDRKKRAVTGPAVIEMVVVLDALYIAELRAAGQATNDSLVEVMAMKFTGIQAEWKRAELNYDITLDIKELVLWENNPSWYTASSVSGTTLESICNGAFTQGLWTNFDMIYLFTGKAMETPGKAYTGKVCDPDQKCGISNDYRISEYYTTAHEIGHLLGMNHDYDIGCGSPNDGIMGYKVYSWSTCSITELDSMFQTNKADCLLTTDVSSPSAVNVQNAWPGLLYTKDEICEFRHGPGYRYRQFPYTAWSICSLHSCINDDESSPAFGAMFNHGVPTDGIYCGVGRVCSSQANGSMYECLTRADTGLDLSLFTEQQGGWSAWGAMTSCSRTCGTGMRYQKRRCDSPKPLNVAGCEGPDVYAEACNIDPCPGDSTDKSTLITERANEKCAAIKASGLYETMGLNSANFENTGQIYHYAQWGQCEVKCNAVTGYAPTTFQRYGLIPDGTPCTDTSLSPVFSEYDEVKNLPRRSGLYTGCVQGYCYLFGCDHTTAGNVYDECGVCNGDNSTCQVVQGVFTDIFAATTRVDLTTLPVGTHHIQFHFPINEMKVNRFEVYTRENFGVLTYHYLNTLNAPLNIGGTHWYYNYYEQVLYADGPTTTRVTIKLYNQLGNDNVGVNYAYSIPNDVGSCTGSCLNGGTWNPDYCDCDCPSGFYDVDCGQTCNKYCFNGKPYLSGLCQCDCQHDTYGTDCNTCKYPFTGESCATCKKTTCANGGVFNQTACRCDCPDGYGELDCSTTCRDAIGTATCEPKVQNGDCDTDNANMERDCYKSCGLCVLGAMTTTTVAAPVTTAGGGGWSPTIPDVTKPSTGKPRQVKVQTENAGWSVAKCSVRYTAIILALSVGSFIF